MVTPKVTCGFPAFVTCFLLATHLMADEPTPDPAPGETAFETAAAETEWAEAFSDPCTKDWKAKWFLDGEVGSVTNSPEGMTLTAGPEFKNDAHHMVLWTKDSFEGDLKIEYEYTRLDEARNCVNILYIQATGSGKCPYAQDISKWSDLRKVPSMKTYYNHMHAYHISYAVGDKKYIRGRRYIPDKQGLKGTDLKPDYFTPELFATGVKHHITVIKKDRDLYMRVENPDRVVYCHMNNAELPVISEGRIGLRHMFTRSARYANFRVSRPTPKRIAEAEPASGPGAILPFGIDGKRNMLYDARQRPQSVLLHGRVYIVYNGEARPTRNGRGDARPTLITYDPKTRRFSESTKLGSWSSDHHYSPVIWADEDDHLHVLYGCHRTPGTHLISARPVTSRTEKIVWKTAPQIAPKLSYPTVYRIYDQKEVMAYRTNGHTSSWTYRISEDNGKTWVGPPRDVVDLDSKGKTDWSSYRTALPSRDGRYLHMVYTDYDDYITKKTPDRLFNPRYKQNVDQDWKYNLHYVKIDLRTHRVTNADGETLRTPIDLAYSKEKCLIWDTDWRGAGIPPVIALDADGEPTFLHILSEGDLKSHGYYYVCRENGKWRQTRIHDSNHNWNGGYMVHDDDGNIHTYLITGQDYLEGGYMDGRGGGTVEHWISKDKGKTWAMHRDLTPGPKQYPGWRFNHVQPVVRPDGTRVEGMLLFYGWKDADTPTAKAFLLDEGS